MDKKGKATLKEELERFLEIKLDFSDEIKENAVLEEIIREELNKCARNILSESNKPKLNEDLSHYVLVCNLPKVEETKLGKFKEVMQKTLAKVGYTQFTKEALEIPMEEKSQKSYGCMVLDFKDGASANKAVNVLGKVKIGKKKFKTLLLTDYDKILEEKMVEKDSQIVTIREMNEWLLDVSAEQFVMHVGNKATVYWNVKPTINQMTPTQLKIDRPISEAKNLLWSPQGTYLVIIKANVVELYGGMTFVKLKEFYHIGVKGLLISPNENYILTWDSITKDDRAEKSVIIWDLKEEKPIRVFDEENFNGNSYKWSFDEKYLAKRSLDNLAIFESPTMDMLADASGKKTSIKYEAIQDFEWCPLANKIVFWKKPADARPFLGVIEIPTRFLSFSKTMATVDQIKIEWNQQEMSFAVLETNSSSKKKGTREEQFSHTIEIVHFVRQKQSISKLETGEILNFAWNPGRIGQFALIEKMSGPKDILGQPSRTTILKIYKQDLGDRNLAPLLQYEKKYPLSDICFSGQGQFLVAGNFQSANLANTGGMQFFYLGENEVFNMGLTNHQYAEAGFFDSSGLYFISSVSRDRTDEPSFHIYDTTGKVIFDSKCLWRPRPKGILDIKEMEEIKANLGEYATKYKKIDTRIYEDKQKSTKDKKDKDINQFLKEFLTPKLKAYEADRGKREAILGHPEWTQEDMKVEYMERDKILSEELREI